MTCKMLSVEKRLKLFEKDMDFIVLMYLYLHRSLDNRLLSMS